MLVTMEKEIINMIKTNRFLYDKNDPDNKNTGMRNEKFEDLAKKLNVTVKTLKNRWRTLRDNFRRELKRCPSPTHAKWKWMDELSFLSVNYTNLEPSTYVKITKEEAEDPFSNIDSSDFGDYCGRNSRSSSAPDSPGRAPSPAPSSVTSIKSIKPPLNVVEIEAEPEEEDEPDEADTEAGEEEDEKYEPPSKVPRITKTKKYPKPKSESPIKRTSINMFFEGLTQQVHEEGLTNMEFSSLQIRLLQSFNEFLYNKSKGTINS